VVVEGVTVYDPPLDAVPIPWLMVPVPPLKEQVRIELSPSVMVYGAARKLAIRGGAAMTHVAVPTWDAEPAAFVTVQPRLTEPEAPAVKVIWFVVLPAVIVPPVMVQA
jgi:hypothetical protein